MSSGFFVKTVACLSFGTLVVSQPFNPNLVGTWTSKSAKVFTGPTFYDPSTGEIYEPPLTGISYSFTDDGHYEEALFRAISNPVDPACPGAIIQWQHGSYVQAADSSLQLTPIDVDGRQILSEPCQLSTSVLTLYSQPENFSKALVRTDLYNDLLRLDLYQWDGTPVNPMWLANSNPLMLPTTTLTPRPRSVSYSAFETGYTKVKRKVSGDTIDSLLVKSLFKRLSSMRDWWLLISFMCLVVGSVLYLSF